MPRGKKTMSSVDDVKVKEEPEENSKEEPKEEPEERPKEEPKPRKKEPKAKEVKAKEPKVNDATVEKDEELGEPVKKDEKKRGRKRKGDDDARKPKRCPTSYILFAKEFQKTMGETLTLGEKSKRCSEAWTKMSDEEKDKYRDMSTAMKEEMRKNAPSLPEKKKRRLSSYILFSMDYRKNFSDEIPFAERSKKCALAWQEMSDAEKQAWKPAEVV